MEVKYFLLILLITATFLCADTKVVVVGTPVVYTKTNGGGPDEIRGLNHSLNITR